MIDNIDEQIDDEILGLEILDEALEAAALNVSVNARVYTQFGLCTMSVCPGSISTR
jgi:hypothetical protein